jgi:hypothetical protein
MTRRGFSGAALAALTLFTSPAVAQDAATVAIHGFVSQGYLETSANRLGGATTDEGTFAFTEEALNVTWQPSSKLRVGAQVFARDFGNQGNHAATFDWAVGDYRWRDALGIRAGRLKLPLGLYTTVVDADAARPEILQPDAVYSVSSRDVTVTFDGVQVYGLLDLGPGGDLEYEAWAGTADLEGSAALTRLLREGSGAIAAALPLTGTDFQVGAIEAPSRLYGGAVEWRPPLSGLRLRTGVNAGAVDLSTTTLFAGYAGPAPLSFLARTKAEIDQNYFWVTSAEYQRGGLRVTAEYARQSFDIATTITGLPFPGPVTSFEENRPDGYYAQVAYRPIPKLQTSAYYSAIFVDRSDREGARQALRGLPEHRGYQKNLAVTARIDVTSNWLVKAEFHDVNGTSGVNSADQPEGVAGLQKDWRIFLAKTTFYF